MPKRSSVKASGAGGRGGSWLLPLFLLSPALVLLLGIVAYPILRAVWLSFHRLEILRPDLSLYVGFDNYHELLRDPVIRIRFIQELPDGFEQDGGIGAGVDGGQRHGGVHAAYCS